MDGFELQAIAAAVLGGCALNGGKGTIIRGVLRVIILRVLNNGMILTNASNSYQIVARDWLLILAVLVAEQQVKRYG